MAFCFRGQMKTFKYDCIAEYYRERIVRSVIVAGDKLPSIRAIAKYHGVSISTASKVMALLEQQGFIYVKLKSGYYVKEQTRNAAQTYGTKVVYKPNLMELPLQQSVQYSFNDESILPLSCTGASTVLDNEALLNTLHRKVIRQRPYQLQQDNFEAGLPELRNALATYLNQLNCHVSEHELLITRGRSDGLLIALSSLNLLDKWIAIEAPSSFFINANLTRLNVNTLAIPMQGSYTEEIQLLDSTYQERPFSAYVFNPNFNDPTGRVLSDKEKQLLLEWAQSRNVVLIEYDRGELSFTDNRPKPITSFVTNKHTTPVISLADFTDTVSFSFSLGYMICHQCADACLFSKHILAEKADSVSQLILHSLLTSGSYRKLTQRLRRKMYDQYLQTRVLLKPLEQHIEVSTIEGGPCIWLKLPDGKSAEKLYAMLLAQNISIAPGSMFFQGEQCDRYFRITFALPWDKKMRRGLRLFVENTLIFLDG